MSHRFFTNFECEYYPCHKTERINCLFCFCPLYHRKDCGGNYTILENGLKDCSKCMVPHKENGYDYIMEKIQQSANITFN